MAVKKNTRKSKKKSGISTKKVKKAKKKTAKSSQKSVKKVKKPSQKKTKKTVSRKSVSKKNLSKNASKKTADKKSTVQKKQPALKKTTTGASSYLNELELELKRILEKNKHISIKGSEGFEYCFEENCDQPSTTGGYCRYHYMVSWGYIKKRNKILSENKLKTWTIELIQNHSPRILDYMIRDLSNEKDFSTALSEMKLSKKSSSY